MTTIAISGASGHLGRLTAEFLLDRVDPSSVVLLTRSPEKLADLAARGATVRAADFHDPAGVTAALEGVDRFLLVSTDTVGDRLDQQVSAIGAAKAAGVGHVVYTSVTKASGEHPALVTPDHLGTEQALQASGLTWTILRNNLYAEFQIQEGAPAVASGQLFTNAPDGKVSWVSRVDLARAAAAVLAAESGHDGAVYELGGAVSLTRRDFAAILADVTGQPVEVVAVDDAGLTAGLVGAGLPEGVAGILASFGVAAREGYLDAPSDIIEQLTGKPAEALREVLAAVKDELLAAPAAH